MSDTAKPSKSKKNDSDALFLLINESSIGHLRRNKFCTRLDEAGVQYKIRSFECGDFQWSWRCNDETITLPVLVKTETKDSGNSADLEEESQRLTNWHRGFSQYDFSVLLHIVFEKKLSCTSAKSLKARLEKKTDLEVSIHRTDNLQQTVYLLTFFTADVAHRLFCGEFDSLKRKRGLCKSIDTGYVQVNKHLSTGKVTEDLSEDDIIVVEMFSSEKSSSNGDSESCENQSKKLTTITKKSNCDVDCRKKQEKKISKFVESKKRARAVTPSNFKFDEEVKLDNVVSPAKSPRRAKVYLMKTFKRRLPCEEDLNPVTTVLNSVPKCRQLFTDFELSRNTEGSDNTKTGKNKASSFVCNTDSSLNLVDQSRLKEACENISVNSTALDPGKNGSTNRRKTNVGGKKSRLITEINDVSKSFEKLNHRDATTEELNLAKGDNSNYHVKGGNSIKADEVTPCSAKFSDFQLDDELPDLVLTTNKETKTNVPIFDKSLLGACNVPSEEVNNENSMGWSDSDLPDLTQEPVFNEWTEYAKKSPSNLMELEVISLCDDQESNQSRSNINVGNNLPNEKMSLSDSLQLDTTLPNLSNTDSNTNPPNHSVMSVINDQQMNESPSDLSSVDHESTPPNLLREEDLCSPDEEIITLSPPHLSVWSVETDWGFPSHGSSELEPTNNHITAGSSIVRESQINGVQHIMSLLPHCDEKYVKRLLSKCNGDITECINYLLDAQ